MSVKGESYMTFGVHKIVNCDIVTSVTFQ